MLGNSSDEMIGKEIRNCLQSWARVVPAMPGECWQGKMKSSTSGKLSFTPNRKHTPGIQESQNLGHEMQIF